MTINKNFKELLEKKDVRFTIILGSGYHRQALGGNSILSSWELLLKQLDPGLKTTRFYPLDYEQLILKRGLEENVSWVEGKASYKIEEQISKEICHDIECAQRKALKFNKEKYPTWIFNPKKVSDIISLNFDTLAEELCTSILLGNKPAERKVSIFESTNDGKMEIPFWEVKSENDGSIRFWYPHGSIHEPYVLKLGTREYAKHLADVERLRKFSKKKEKEVNTDTSWYHQMVHNPILILGAELSHSEWDIWFALVNRARNFSKEKNQGFINPIFQMRDKNYKSDFRRNWFQLIYTGLEFKKQWEEVELLINKIK
jgi:hypothetical protein